MTTQTVITRSDEGGVTITKTDDAPATPAPPPPPGIATIGVPTVVVHRHHSFDYGAFIGGMLFGLLLYFIAQTWVRWQRHRPVDFARKAPEADRMAADVAALARRTATLETIVTDPARRTAEEIDALR